MNPMGDGARNGANAAASAAVDAPLHGAGAAVPLCG